ncbi:MFS transporter [Streptomyces sp. DSM 44917]|uniref:MFS transporter n=1 Tax=Streptomyces boetiae TaxID=3075541 RepID=A0ABU2L838_9ACTN|nr:MFS transporter [Streptomyces sp. DSM 44917]MDT0307631.1 MFS transporter [Streptomyces sp. DSM 44917]
MTTTQTPADPTPADQTPAAAGRTEGTGAAGGRPARPGWLLALLLSGLFMALLDVFIVNVAAPTVRADLGASGGELQLVIAGYTISYAVLLITGARLGGRYGPGRLYLTGLVVFTAASLACGLAGAAWQLIGFRFVQGAGAALMLPQVLSIIQRSFTGPARARALTLYAAVIAVGAAAGQLVGGVLISADLFGAGWRPVFLVNVPLGVILLLLGLRLLPLERPPAAERGRPLDLPGLTLLTAAVLLFTVPLVLGQEEGWPLWCLLSLVAAALLAGAFVAFEARPARRGGAPLLSPRVLGSPGVPLAAVRIFLVMAVNGGILFALSLHFQAPEEAGGLGYGALHSGLLFLPTAVMFGAVSLLWRRLPARLWPYLTAGGFLLSAAAILAMLPLLGDGQDAGALALLAFGVNGGANALAYSTTLNRSLASVRPEDAADASGVTAMTTQLGMLVGIAAFGTLYLDRASAAASSAEGLAAALPALAAGAAAGAAAALLTRLASRRGRA